jgi:thymidylate synthase
MNHVKINSFDCPDAWYKTLRAIWDKGTEFKVGYGSEMKLTKKLNLTIEIDCPKNRPLLHEKAPNDQTYLNWYAGTYLWYPDKDDAEYCYDGQTEVLTNNGWKIIRDVNSYETIATLNPENNKIEYQSQKLHRFKYKGKMVSFNSKHINFIVNPPHKQYVKEVNHHEQIIKKIFSLVPTENIRSKYLCFKRNGIWEGEYRFDFLIPPTIINKFSNKKYEKYKKYLAVSMNNWLDFFGIWLAEGSLRNNDWDIIITQVQEDKKEIIKQWITSCGFHFCGKDKNLVIQHKQLYDYLKQFGHSHDKFIPRELLILPKEQLIHLYNSMMLGDGNKKGNIYSTVSTQLADDFQELCFKLGYGATKRYDYEDHIYRIFICKDKYLEPCIEYNPEEIDYDGEIYCPEVPNNHIIYVRRKGKAFWSGNTYGNRMRKSKTPSEMLDELSTLPLEELAKHNEFFDLLCKLLDEKHKSVDQLQEVIDRFKQEHMDRQCTVVIRRPEDIIKGKVKDPPCLTMIDFEIIDGELCATAYFRSWDAYAGLPCNIAGIEMILEFMASEIGVPSGKLIFHSKNCHIYERQFELVNELLNPKGTKYTPENIKVKFVS